MKVHPTADLFPLLTGEQFEELVEGIRQNGLIHPIVLDAPGTTIIDGRNRLAACDAAGVEPRYEQLPAEADLVSYILEANVARRHLTKGQRAMARALVVAGEEGPITLTRTECKTVSKSDGYSGAVLQAALFVLRHAPDLADAVMAGSPLDAAVERARLRKEVQDASEKDEGWLQRESERRRKKLEDQRRNDVEAVTRLQEDIGDPVPLPPEPELGLVNRHGQTYHPGTTTARFLSSEADHEWSPTPQGPAEPRGSAFRRPRQRSNAQSCG